MMETGVVAVLMSIVCYLRLYKTELIIGRRKTYCVSFVSTVDDLNFKENWLE